MSPHESGCRQPHGCERHNFTHHWDPPTLSAGERAPWRRKGFARPAPRPTRRGGSFPARRGRRTLDRSAKSRTPAGLPQFPANCPGWPAPGRDRRRPLAKPLAQPFLPAKDRLATHTDGSRHLAIANAGASHVSCQKFGKCGHGFDGNGTPNGTQLALEVCRVGCIIARRTARRSQLYPKACAAMKSAPVVGLPAFDAHLSRHPGALGAAANGPLAAARRA